MSTPITPEALIEMGFSKAGHWLSLDFIEVDTIRNNIWCYARLTNATTIEDIKDLIRLFK